MNSLQPCFPTQITAWTRSRSTANPKGGLALVAVARAAWMALLVLAAWIGLQGVVRAQGSPGSNDPSFNVVDDGTYGYGANGSVGALALQPDGKVLIGGDFTTYNGTTRNGIARLNSDGSLDTAFNPGTGVYDGSLGYGYVAALAPQPDGKVLIGGGFTTYNGTPRNRIARLNSDGSLDTSFNPGEGAGGSVSPDIMALALQPDGKVLIGGGFTTYNGTGRNGIARLNSDGSLDTSFNPGSGATGNVFALALQPGGKVLVGGFFSSYNGITRNSIARLNSDGSLDTSFNPGTPAHDGNTGPICLELALQPNGKVLIGGSIFFFGTTRSWIARLNSDGSLDTSFNQGTWASGNWVVALALQPDGKVLVGGEFTTYNNSWNSIARLNSDGGLDTSFNPGSGANGGGFSNPYVGALALQADGKLLIGGDFTSYNGTPRTRIARVHAYDPFPAYCGGQALACPCGNVGAGAAGCANSVSPGGALLAGAGMPSLANDTVVLSGSAMPNSSALYFQGTVQTAIAFGDGQRCAAGAVVRIGTKANASGASRYPGAGDLAVSVRGGVAQPGVRHYQAWYHNAAAFCTPSSFNLTNGISVTWTP
jgi:uncharacterized delta-60 repeat protein